MPATVDHISIAVSDLSQAIATFTALGFALYNPEGRAYTRDRTLEFVASDEAEGPRYIAIASDRTSLHADLNDLPLRFFNRPPRRPEKVSHPNTVLHLERAYIAVADLRPAATRYARVLEVPLPQVQRGNVIKADMCIFQVGSVGIGVAQPVEPGPAAEALQRRGPGPFQVLFRVHSMSEATRHLQHFGVQPARGTRNTGEPALLVGPDQACGVYVAFVGPE
jgi:hypothetical protein